MGSIVFLIPRRHLLSRQAVDCAYMVGSDGIPWETQVVQRGDRLTVTRDTQESGRLVIPWRTASGRDVALSTATLLSSDAPYHLPLELSRGTINQLQSQVALWESRGLPASPAVREGLADALGHFVRASLSRADVDRCADEAEAALNIALSSSITGAVTLSISRQRTCPDRHRPACGEYAWRAPPRQLPRWPPSAHRSVTGSYVPPGGRWNRIPANGTSNRWSRLCRRLAPPTCGWHAGPCCASVATICPIGSTCGTMTSRRFTRMSSVT